MENKKRWIRIAFFLYLLGVLKVIVFKYPMERLWDIVTVWDRSVIRDGIRTANFVPFKTIRMYIEYSYKLNSFENLIGNVLVFVPFGFLLPHVLRRGKNFFVLFFHALLFVLGMEVFQLVSGFGAFDVDDILLNCLGAVLGYMLYCCVEIGKKWYEKSKAD